MRDRRAALGLTVQQLADRMEKDPRQVRRIERGESNMSLDCLLRLGSALELPLLAVEEATPVPLPTLQGPTPHLDTDDDAPASPALALAQELVARRARRRWSQRDLAAEARVSVSLVKGLETGRNSPTLHSLEALAAALETTVIELLGGRTRHPARRRRSPGR